MEQKRCKRLEEQEWEEIMLENLKKALQKFRNINQQEQSKFSTSD